VGVAVAARDTRITRTPHTTHDHGSEQPGLRVVLLSRHWQYVGTVGEEAP